MLSEELAFQACAELANELLQKHGIATRYTGPQLLVDFVGQNFRGMLTSLTQKYDFALSDEELDEYVGRELQQVIAALERDAQPCEGVNEQLEELAREGRYGLAVVSSSALSRVQAALAKVGQAQYFAPAHVFSAASSLPTPTSKPDPAVYLHALAALGKQARECVAVEDSKSGTLSAVRAGIPVIGYVGSYEGAEMQAQMRKELEATGAQVVMFHWSEFRDCLAKIEQA